MHQAFAPPLATYRLQFHRGFTFGDAAHIAGYLARLGVSHVYASPYLQARPGSTHGYDICDHNQLNPEIGSDEDYARLTEALERAGLRQMLDFVPNHMGIDPATNPWWRDVLENGRASGYARFFDVDWDPVKPELKGKVLLPILGDQYGLVLERGELHLGFDAGAPHLSYSDNDLPVNPRASIRLYEHGLAALQEHLGHDDPDLREFLSILTSLRNLPADSETAPDRIAERRREKDVARDRLARLVERAPAIADHIRHALEVFNGRVGNPSSFDLLHGLLEEQAYRLAYWRTASEEINYRRFFDINGLAALRMEDLDVFEATHALLFRLLQGGAVSALRIDHPDGLNDPATYFDRLQELWTRTSRSSEPLCVLAEKILSRGEDLLPDWAIAGTTGYEFANAVIGVLVDPSGERPLRALYTRLTGRPAGPRAFEEEVYECKKLITRTSLASELNVLAHALNRISESNRRSRDFTLESLRTLLQEVVACFPVYRTYVSPRGWTTMDRERLETAVERARARDPSVPASLFDFLREVVLPRHDPPSQGPGDRRDGYGPEDREAYETRLGFAMKLQQYTAPVQAKGVEDTAFYRYNVLLALNEVGGEPGQFGLGARSFHDAAAARAREWPLALSSTSTHDTKLGEDVRARLAVLSEIPLEWRRQVWRWARLNARHRATVDGSAAPDRNDEYRFYQVLAGAWAPSETAGQPSDEFVQRLRDYMVKACKEAKIHTSWINDNEAYDHAIASFVERTLARSRSARFLDAFGAFQARLAELGVGNMLAQVVLKLIGPGVPDVYQGGELWDFHLVDPDNRRPVDFTVRDEMLASLEPLLARCADARDETGVEVCRGVEAMMASWQDGRIKMWVTACGLRLRRQLPDLFLHGDYQPLVVARSSTGADALAFARRFANDSALAVVSRWLSRQGSNWREWAQGWGDAHIVVPREWLGRRFRNLVNGGVIAVEDHKGHATLRAERLLVPCPVAILVAV